jgi:hypothetical protein
MPGGDLGQNFTGFRRTAQDADPKLAEKKLLGFNYMLLQVFFTNEEGLYTYIIIIKYPALNAGGEATLFIFFTFTPIIFSSEEH